MRDHYPKRCKHDIPEQVWYLTLWTLRDYDRLTESGRHPEKVRVINKGLQLIPEGIREGLWKSLKDCTPYPQGIPKAVCRHYKEDLIYYVAKRLYFL